MSWQNTIKKFAPTVASALLGPMGGIAVEALGSLLGVSNATADTIAEVIQTGRLTPEQIGKIKELELQYQENERERGFKYAELAFKDRDSARTANVQGGTAKMLFCMSIVLLLATLGCEIGVLFGGIPTNASPLVVGRVLGLMDSVALMVLAYHYGSSSGSADKTALLASK